MSELILPKTHIQKSQVALPPPGHIARWAVIGGQNQLSDIPLPDKRQQYAIYYEMYRQHPVVRAAIDKKASYAAAGGFVYRPVDPSVELKAWKTEILDRFFRNSHSSQLISLTFRDLDIYGESFWLIQKTLNGRPMRAWRINPRYMLPIVRGGKIIRWKYGPVQGDDSPVNYEVEEILHFKLPDPENDVAGLSPLHSIQRAVAQDIFAMEYNESFFRNSAQTGTIFIVKTSTEAEAKRNRQWLEENYIGPQNAHRPILLEGDVEVDKSVSNAQEMEFLQGRILLRQEIAMALEVDLDKLGVHESSNRSVSREVDDAFHSESIMPRQVVLEEEINNVLIRNTYGWTDLLIDFKDRDPRRTADQADTDNKNLNSGRENLNEQRKRLGLGPVEGGNIHFISTPTGLIFVDALPELLKAQKRTLLPATGAGSKGQASPPVGSRESLTRRQAEDSSQKE